jgi:hypothetical protein
MTSRPALWGKIQQFELDDPHAEFQFSARLAKENGWTRPFTEDAIQEYRKFVYLAAVSNGEVTPPKTIDTVWHQHLTYTRSYWDEMCGEVLGFPLHHNPTRGGSAEDARFEDQYEQTLDLYRTEFGEEPPSAIWPRIGESAPQRAVRRSRIRMRVSDAIVAAAAVTIATSGAVLAADGETSHKLPVVLIAVGLAVFFLLFAILGARVRRGRGGSGYTCNASGSGTGDSGHNHGHGHGHGGDGGGGHSCGGHGCGGSH